MAALTYKEVNWNNHTATLRTVRKEHVCAVCKESLRYGFRVYVITTWNSGFAGKKFPDYCCPECLESYSESHAGAK